MTSLQRWYWEIAKVPCKDWNSIGDGISPPVAPDPASMEILRFRVCCFGTADGEIGPRDYSTYARAPHRTLMYDEAFERNVRWIILFAACRGAQHCRARRSRDRAAGKRGAHAYTLQGWDAGGMAAGCRLGQAPYTAGGQGRVRAGLASRCKYWNNIGC